MTSRRSFLGSILVLGAAPAIVRADALMRVVPRETTLLLADDVRFSAVDFNWDPASPTIRSVTRMALFTSDGDVRVLDLAWGKRRPQVLTGTEGRHR